MVVLLLQLTRFLADSTDSHVVVGLVVGLNPSAQAHVTHRCGTKHDKGNCPAKGQKCHKFSHFARCCKTKT